MNPGRLHILSTGQAARYCGVTGDTVANWVKAGRLRATRTPGGRYRLEVEELHRFMRENGLPTDRLDIDFSLKPHCWEFWAMRRAAAGLICDHCVTRQNNAWKCWELHRVLPPAARQCGECRTCEYFASWGRGERPQVSVCVS